ncbi:MAG: Ldh family oxidoreductase [Pseudomonadota bacterium]
MNVVELSLDEISELAHAALTKAGADAANAAAVARTVTRAERDGSTSHGLFRIPGYVASLKSGKVNGAADPKPENVTPVVLRCDGQNGYAPLAHERCVDALARAASEYGVAALALTRSHHFAALWPETEALAERGLVGLTCVSYMPMVAPAGGREKFFGTNPLSFAWPRPGRDPLVFDMATAAIAMGEVQIAARDGHDVPLGTGLDADGTLTTDPKEILKGVLLPFGGYKGSAIAMMIELLAGPLVGEAVSYRVAERDTGDGGPPEAGQMVLALSPDILSGTDWVAQAEPFLEKLEAMEGVRLPGARRHNNRANDGPRSVNAVLVEKIRRLAAD